MQLGVSLRQNFPKTICFFLLFVVSFGERLDQEKKIGANFIAAKKNISYLAQKRKKERKKENC